MIKKSSLSLIALSFFLLHKNITFPKYQSPPHGQNSLLFFPLRFARENKPRRILLSRAMGHAFTRSAAPKLHGSSSGTRSSLFPRVRVRFRHRKNFFLSLFFLVFRPLFKPLRKAFSDFCVGSWRFKYKPLNACGKG